MASIFEALDKVRQRPGLYLGGDESQRRLQLQNLEQLLCGYSLALHQHHIKEPVADFIREFGTYIWKTRGWSASCGPIAAILAGTSSDEEAWDLFWELVDEFRASVHAHER